MIKYPQGWPRKYPPLAAAMASLVLAVFVLPSALNLPTANPGQTLEYAPVPGNSGAATGGNLAGLGLGATGTIGAGAGGYGAGLLPSSNGAGNVPSEKQCVGTPLRQTEDPLAPPCVAFFNGDNGGATYPGVSSTEIRVLVYSDSNFAYSNCNTDNNNPPSPRYYDLWQAPDSSENTCVTRAFRVWQTYFNERYQTYNRRVHFWVYFSSIRAGGDTASARRADAADNFARIHPFATMLGYDINGYEDAYMAAMASHGVMYFTSQDFLSKSFFQQYAPQLWGYAPSLEEKAGIYASYICAEIAPYPVSFSGNNDTGSPRIYGLIETTDSSKPELRRFQDLVASKVGACGINFQDTEDYPIDGDVAYTGPQSQSYSGYAEPAMVRMQQRHVTTVIWPAGFETQFSNAAAAIHYYPEWVTGGDGTSDGFAGTVSQDPQVWSHAVNVSTSLLLDSSQVEQPCRQAYQETDPSASTFDVMYGCHYWYDSLRQLFTGIQVAGPKLTPSSMAQGYRAIPPHASSSPQVPACYYNAGDYTCVKDAIQMYWDPAAVNAANQAGCWRVIDSGKRFPAGEWPDADPRAQRSSADPCNGFQGNRFIFLAQPGTG